jgi:hypothetical protein
MNELIEGVVSSRRAYAATAAAGLPTRAAAAGAVFTAGD